MKLILNFIFNKLWVCLYAKVIKKYECYKMMYFLNVTQNFTILNFACYSKFCDF